MGQRPDTVLPAVCLIITGALNAAFGLYGLVSGIIHITNPANRPTVGSEAERFGYYTGQSAVVIVFLLSLVTAPVIIYGAVKMFKGSGYN